VRKNRVQRNTHGL